jgi:DNA-binding GntR family transcriptional regulator
MRLADYAGTPELKEAIEKNQVLIYNWFYDVAAERRALPPRFHSDLIAVITGNDILAADEAMRKHVQYGQADIIARITPPKREWRLKR